MIERRSFDMLAILLAATMVCFSFLNWETSWGSHEARRAVIAAEMAESHDFLVPRRLAEFWKLFHVSFL